MPAVLLFSMLFIMLLICVPIGYAIGLSSIFYLILTHAAPLATIPAKMIVGGDSFLFLAVPMFTFAGYLMEMGGISERLINWVNKLCGRIPGSLGAVTIITCTIFAALTGSGAATVAAVGAILYPLMIKQNYPEDQAAATIAAGGTLGPIIPPSITMIIYGSAMGVSVSDMFLGGVVPGLIIAVLFLAFNTFFAIKHKIPRDETKYSGKEILLATWKSLGVLMLPVIILGGIYSGIVTPTEAAALAIVYSLALMIAFKQFTLKRFLEICQRTVKTTSVIMLIVTISNAFAYVLTIERVPALIANALTPLIGSATTYMVILIILLLIVGALMDSAPAILILAPILVPIGLNLGIDPLHLGIVFCVTLIVGLITPPFGINLFTAVATTGVSFEHVTRRVIPFIVCAVISILVIAFIPQTVTFLPRWVHAMGG